MNLAIASMSLQFAAFQNFIFPNIEMKVDFKNVTKSLFPQKYLIMVLITNVNIVNMFCPQIQTCGSISIFKL